MLISFMPISVVFLNTFIYLFLGVLSLHCYADFSLVVTSGGYFPVTGGVPRLLIAVASLDTERGF